MKAEEMDKTFDALRELPVEVTVEQVGSMVAVFTLAPPVASWLSHINLNSFLMTSAGASIIAGSIYLFSPNDPGPQAERKQVPTLVPAIEQIATPSTTPPSGGSHEMDPAPDRQAPKMEDPAVVDPILAFVPPVPPTPPVPAKRSITIIPSTTGAPSLQPCTLIMGTTPEGSPRTEDVRGLESLELPLAAYNAGIKLGSNGREFDLSGFTGITVQGAMNVMLEQGDFSVKAEGDPGLLEQLELTMKDKMLVIANRKNENGKEECSSGKSVTVHVRMPTLERFKLTGSGDVAIGDFTNEGTLDLDLQGSGDIHFASLKGLGALTIDLDGSGDILGEAVQVSGKTKISLAGSGDVRIAGRSDVIEVDLVGSGDVDASALETRDCDVQVIGSGDVGVNCNGSMRSRAMGSGDVHNTGSAGGGGTNEGSRSN